MHTDPDLSNQKHLPYVPVFLAHVYMWACPNTAWCLSNVSTSGSVVPKECDSYPQLVALLTYIIDWLHSRPPTPIPAEKFFVIDFVDMFCLAQCADLNRPCSNYSMSMCLFWSFEKILIIKSMLLSSDDTDSHVLNSLWSGSTRWVSG